MVNKFSKLYSGIRLTLMSIVRAIRQSAREIKLGVIAGASDVFEADGTGIPVSGAGKRGKELKVLAQRRKGGGIFITGMAIGGYKQGWDKLFQPLKAALKKLGEIILVTDGDTSPLKSWQGIRVIIQRCLFHIGHEMKYMLWKDKIKRQSELWNEVMAKTLAVTSLRRIWENPEVCHKIIEDKKSEFEKLIAFCEEHRLRNAATFLKTAQGDVFSGIEKRIGGGATSLMERVRRTVNQRINVAKWSTASALSVAIIRGAYYYNGYDV